MRLRTLLAVWLAWTPLGALAAVPEIGQPVPDFEFQGVGDEVFRRADYVGKRAVVLAWFPKAFTPG
jgi:peroxiredoxin Q/BCP